MHFIFSGASLSDTQPIASFQANHAPNFPPGKQLGAKQVPRVPGRGASESRDRPSTGQETCGIPPSV